MLFSYEMNLEESYVHLMKLISSFDGMAENWDPVPGPHDPQDLLGPPRLLPTSGTQRLPEPLRTFRISLGPPVFLGM